jgi:hypothetical protein
MPSSAVVPFTFDCGLASLFVVAGRRQHKLNYQKHLTKELGEQFASEQSQGVVRVGAENGLINFLRTEGYSERAIEEICKWYVCSTTKASSGRLPAKLKN